MESLVNGAVRKRPTRKIKIQGGLAQDMNSYIVMLVLSSDAIISTIAQPDHFLRSESTADRQDYGREKRTIWNFPIRKLLNGATRMGESIMLGRVYQKAEGFLKAKEDFLSLNPKVVFESDKHDGWIGKVQDKKIYLYRMEYNRAVIQVVPPGFLSQPILTIKYGVPK